MAGKVPFCCPKLLSLWTKDSQPQKPKSVNIFVGFFFVIIIPLLQHWIPEYSLSVLLRWLPRCHPHTPPDRIFRLERSKMGVRDHGKGTGALVYAYYLHTTWAGVLRTDINIIKTHSINSCVSSYWTDVNSLVQISLPVEFLHVLYVSNLLDAHLIVYALTKCFTRV